MSYNVQAGTHVLQRTIKPNITRSKLSTNYQNHYWNLLCFELDLNDEEKT